jgi:hypothetical protein
VGSDYSISIATSARTEKVMDRQQQTSSLHRQNGQNIPLYSEDFKKNVCHLPTPNEGRAGSKMVKIEMFRFFNLELSSRGRPRIMNFGRFLTNLMLAFYLQTIQTNPVSLGEYPRTQAPVGLLKEREELFHLQRVYCVANKVSKRRFRWVGYFLFVWSVFVRPGWKPSDPAGYRSPTMGSKNRKFYQHAANRPGVTRCRRS